ncbi:Aste57867_6921 [Aphanomyces stellatus]|uniref:Aste57867_6921 protein n=1 Tax=Aphanomyces stellatus TaxID=120398 RepID=A0A485KHF4_9STRA|nr:hypothetical protein As57867_006899 [Aphanomyces stellatus]VFT83873.1 Aste57867_6921 [Aphanomyces stellatus]
MTKSSVQFVEMSTPQFASSDVDGTPTVPPRRTRRMLHKRWMLQAIPLTLFVILFLCILIPFMQNNKKIQALRYTNGAANTSVNGGPTNLIISLSGMSTDNYAIAATSTLTKVPASVLNENGTRIATPFRVVVGSVVALYNENTPNVYAPITAQVPLLTGSLAWYPFDTYLMKLEVQTVTGTSQYNAGGFKPLPDFSFQVLAPDDFSWTYTLRNTKLDDFPNIVSGMGTVSDPTVGYTAITIEITRQFNIYMALVFIGIWAVTISVGYIGSMSVIWHRRPADNPVIFVSALFAVPTFRNTAPGKPPYGCLFDILSLYFSIAVIITFLLLVAFSYMKKPKTAVKGDDDTIPVATLDSGGTAGGDVADAGDAAAVSDAA